MGLLIFFLDELDLIKSQVEILYNYIHWKRLQQWYDIKWNSYLIYREVGLVTSNNCSGYQESIWEMGWVQHNLSWDFFFCFFFPIFFPYLMIFWSFAVFHFKMIIRYGKYIGGKINESLLNLCSTHLNFSMAFPKLGTHFHHLKPSAHCI